METTLEVFLATCEIQLGETCAHLTRRKYRPVARMDIDATAQSAIARRVSSRGLIPFGRRKDILAGGKERKTSMKVRTKALDFISPVEMEEKLSSKHFRFYEAFSSADIK
ncbi:hypothetical protein R1sor_012728 [Riccia sorocarpa]|uniref:Uncharacterized protein n=1 Tax=Riccia sorocarpa TaxID=122646 RepID=A0ABD3I8K9_9MARC